MVEPEEVEPEFTELDSARETTWLFIFPGLFESWSADGLLFEDIDPEFTVFDSGSGTTWLFIFPELF